MNAIPYADMEFGAWPRTGSPEVWYFPPGLPEPIRRFFFSTQHVLANEPACQ
jgi:hypothetical protein